MLETIKKAILKTPFINSKVLNYILRKKLKAVGKMFDLNIDFKEKKLRCKLNLRGEENPIEVEIDGFEFFEKDGLYFIRIEKLKFGKEWIQALANNFAAGKEFSIEKKYYDLISGMFGDIIR